MDPQIVRLASWPGSHKSRGGLFDLGGCSGWDAYNFVSLLRSVGTHRTFRGEECTLPAPESTWRADRPRRGVGYMHPIQSGFRKWFWKGKEYSLLVGENLAFLNKIVRD